MSIDKSDLATLDACEVSPSVGLAVRPKGPLRRPSMRNLMCRFKTILESYMHWRRRRIAIAQLEALDDRVLTDIGLERSQIAAAVDSMLTRDGDASSPADRAQPASVAPIAQSARVRPPA
jgi:uncharacterized protein YjiS (DUF1127 family)